MRSTMDVSISSRFAEAASCCSSSWASLETSADESLIFLMLADCSLRRDVSRIHLRPRHVRFLAPPPAVPSVRPSAPHTSRFSSQLFITCESGAASAPT